MTLHSTAPAPARPSRRRHWSALAVAVLAAGAAAVGLRTTVGTPASATTGSTKVSSAGHAQAPAPAGNSAATGTRGFAPVAPPGSAAGAGGSHTTTRGS